MITLFQYAPGDQSIAYLAQVFGMVGTVLPTTASTIFAAIFKVLNTMALTLGAILVVHTTVVGLLKTATEGEFLGKQWSSLWVPLRMVIGIAGLFPSAGGYCMIQVVMMWIIVQGVGAADQIWNAWLNTQTQIGSGGTSSNPPFDATAKTTWNNLFVNLMCQATAARNDNFVNLGSTNQGGLYYCGPNSGHTNEAFCSYSNAQLLNVVSGPQVNVSGHTVSYSMGPANGANAACGTIAYGSPTSPYPDKDSSGAEIPLTCPTNSTVRATIIKCAIAQALPQALQGAVSTLGSAASLLAQYDAQYMNFYQNAPPSSNGTNIGWINNYCAGRTPQIAPCCLININNVSSLLQPAQYSSGGGCAQVTAKVFPNSNNGNDLYDGTDSFNMNINAMGTPTSLYTFAIQDMLGLNPNSSNAQDTNIIKTTMDSFYGTINAAVVASLANVPPPAGQWQVTAENLGWLMAGAYYYRITSLTGVGIPPLSANQFTVSMAPMTGPLANYRNNLKAGNSLYTYFMGQSPAPGSISKPPEVTQVDDLMSGVNESVASGFMGMITGNGSQDPLLVMAQLGENMISWGTIAYLVFIAVSSVTVGLASINVLVLGSGMTQNPVGIALNFLLNAMFWAIMFTVGLMFTYGALFAVYIPLIPYFVFTFGVIGWFMSVVETMVAAPFVALGILSPGGEEIMGKATPTIGMIMSIFLKPALMIVGLAFAMILERYVVIPVINNTFALVMGNINSNPSPVELFIFMAAYIFLVITAMNKIFSLIHEVPDRTLRWISFEYRGYGEGEAAGEAGKGIKGVGEAAGGGAKSGMGGASKGAGEAKGNLDKKQGDKDDKFHKGDDEKFWK